jgi:pimeloyl-ACP methyl ester carboxylesterase
LNRSDVPTEISRPTELTIDVSADVPLDEPVFIAASVHLPIPPVEMPRGVLICWPGGSSARAYWDMHIPEHSGYSFAEHMTANGFVVIAADHLGVGASSQPADGDRVNFETMTAAAAAFVSHVRTMRLGGCDQIAGYELGSLPVIGVGHSLGACLTVVTQARYRCYDAVALLGFTHGQKEVAITAAGAAEHKPVADDSVLRETAIEQAKAFFGDTWGDVYGFAPREPHHSWLHNPDVPRAVIAADDAEAVLWPRQAYVEALLAGHSARYAAGIDCNVFLGFGDNDVPPLPHADVAYYTRSHDVTLYVLPNSAHCHNFASTRNQLWDRIGVWAADQRGHLKRAQA